MAWFDTLDDDHRAHIVSKGWDKLEGDGAATAIATAYRGLEKLHGGVSSGEYVKPPGPTDTPEAVKAFWQKLGTPADAKGYDFDALKFKDGTGFDPAFQDQARAAAAKANIPASMLNVFLAEMIPHMEAEETSDVASKQAALEASQRELDTAWGAEAARNKFLVTQAQDTLKVPQEVRDALVGSMGYRATMEHFLGLSKMLGEGRFVPSGGQGGTASLTKEQAQAKFEALSRDDAWRARWAAGGAEEIKTKSDLMSIIAGAP